MPRFENEDFDPKNRNREDIDRTVPKDEDYYNYSPEDIDLNFNSKKERIILLLIISANRETTAIISKTAGEI